MKKQRNRSLLSSFFCCFRDYNVEAPPACSPGVLPPPVEENGGLPKVSAAPGPRAPLPDCHIPVCHILDKRPS